MALIYAGIDEAGYGPLLGPLCVGMACFRVDAWDESQGAPNLWRTLKNAVCRAPRDKKRRIAIDDSKKLKLANSSETLHPVAHLERGVLAFLAARLAEACPDCVPDDLAFLARVGAEMPAEPWYAGDPLPWPVSLTAPEVGIAANRLRLDLERAGVGLLDLRCRVIGEGRFNDLCDAAGTKAGATECALFEHLRTIWDRWAAPGEGGAPHAVRVVCDRQGGRTRYTDLLQRAFPGAEVAETHHAADQSRYELHGPGPDGRERRMHVLFLIESEADHLPVALASMLAKLTRESMMARFNRHWSARLPELKPTAGYRSDAWRWLQDAAPAIAGEDERRALIRRV
jgi:ribonuclease HII